MNSYYITLESVRALTSNREADLCMHEYRSLVTDICLTCLPPSTSLDIHCIMLSYHDRVAVTEGIIEGVEISLTGTMSQEDFNARLRLYVATWVCVNARSSYSNCKNRVTSK